MKYGDVVKGATVKHPFFENVIGRVIRTGSGWVRVRVLHYRSRWGNEFLQVDDDQRLFTSIRLSDIETKWSFANTKLEK